MRYKTKTAFVLAVGMWTVAAFVWPGCISAPLPNGHRPLTFHKQSDFTPPKSPQLTRNEVVSKIGDPYVYLPDLKIACYWVDRVSKRHLSMLLVIPLGVDEIPTGYDVALIQYDDQDRVVRSGLVFQTENRWGKDLQETMEATAKQWLADQEKQKH